MPPPHTAALPPPPSFSVLFAASFSDDWTCQLADRLPCPSNRPRSSERGSFLERGRGGEEREGGSPGAKGGRPRRSRREGGGSPGGKNVWVFQIRGIVDV
jgi:hypothetical protein